MNARKPLLDDDGENRAVRAFLMVFGSPGLTVGMMRNHMEDCGWKDCWPDWVTESHADAHLTKAGAQLWLRHLFWLEDQESSPWLECALAWEVCASIHQTFAKGKDAMFTTRQANFVRHAAKSRARAKP